MNIKHTLQALGLSFVIVAFIFGVAITFALISANSPSGYIQDFNNCHTASGHEMCQ